MYIIFVSIQNDRTAILQGDIDRTIEERHPYFIFRFPLKNKLLDILFSKGFVKSLRNIIV